MSQHFRNTLCSFHNVTEHSVQTNFALFLNTLPRCYVGKFLCEKNEGNPDGSSVERVSICSLAFTHPVDVGPFYLRTLVG